MTKMKENNINDVYKPLLTAESRYFIVTGGRGSGKSYSVAWSILMLSFETEQSIFYTRKTLTSAKTSIIPDFTAVIEDWDLGDSFHVTNDSITNLGSGSVITFMGLTTSSGENSAKMKGLSQATIWVLDEAEELVDEEVFDKANFSIRSKRKQNRIIMIMNPTTKEHFIYQRFFVERGVNAGDNITKDDVTYLHTTYLDNIDNLSESSIRDIERMKRVSPKQFEYVILGGWRDSAEGVIFTNWRTGQFEDIGFSYFGLDWGWSDPNAMIEVKVDKSNKRMYIRELIYETGLVETELLKKVKQKAGMGIIYADSANPGMIESFRRGGLNIQPARKGADSIRLGINFLLDFELIIDPSSTNLIKELNNYVWNDKKSETPIDDWNHLIDSIRYATRHLSVPDFYIT